MEQNKDEKEMDFEKSKKAIRNYKDTVFRELFNDKEELLSLFNAINGTDYTDSSDLTITTLLNVVYLEMKNDLSCILYADIQLYEQQASVNPNMPLRDFFYISRQLEYIVSDKDIYSSKLIKIPTPKFFTLYNGKEEQPAVRKFRLSESFENKEVEPCLELIVTQININKGMNNDLVEKCPTLFGYVTFVARVRENNETMTLEDAIDKAMDDCISEGILKDFFEKNRRKVMDVSILEFSIEKHEKLLKEEGREEGRDEQARSTVGRMLDEGKLTAREISYYVPDFTENDVIALQKERLKVNA